MDLVIVESPTKAKTLARFLGDDYQVLATMGHVRDLPEDSLGVDLEHDFAPQYQPIDKKKEQIEQIQNLVQRARIIYLATDPDREGEAIAWHVAEILNTESRIMNTGQKENPKSTIQNSEFRIHPKIHRITFHEITKSAIDKALAHPGEINLQLVDAQQARRVLDRLVGYQLSPLLWRKIRRGLSAGRVQSVAVRLIVEREREIEAFEPAEYWLILAELADGGSFWAKLNQKVVNQKEADLLVAFLQHCRYTVASLNQKEILQKPAAPFRTATLQQKAAQALGFTSKRTMRIAQALYEKGLITYHRTDSAFLAREALTQIRGQIKKDLGERYLSPAPRLYVSKAKVAQEAHEAIRPTEVALENPPGLDKDAQNLYFLIRRRTLACQMSNALWQNTEVVIAADDRVDHHELLAEGKQLLFDGWLKLYSQQEKEIPLPMLKVNETLHQLSIKPEQKFTLPPPRYTEATLIKTLEQKGIGRPSTYAPIISTIQLRQYAEKIEGKFQPTPLGTAVNDFLLAHFSALFDYAFTAGMEDGLDAIARGDRQWVPLIRDFYQPFSAQLVEVSQTSQRVVVPVEKTGETCPSCHDGELVIRVGRFGKFLSCSRFPACRYTAPLIEKIANVKCPKCQGEIILRRTKKGKRFYGCANYPKCAWASWRKPK